MGAVVVCIWAVLALPPLHRCRAVEAAGQVVVVLLVLEADVTEDDDKIGEVEAKQQCRDGPPIADARCSRCTPRVRSTLMTEQLSQHVRSQPLHAVHVKVTVLLKSHYS